MSRPLFVGSYLHKTWRASANEKEENLQRMIIYWVYHIACNADVCVFLRVPSPFSLAFGCMVIISYNSIALRANPCRLSQAR